MPHKPPLSSMRDYILGAYRSGDMQGLLCPVCSGGNGGEKSFNVFEVSEGVVGYRCHRSSCGAAGRVLTVGETARPPSPARTDIKTLNFVKPTPEMEAEYARQFGLHGPTIHRDFSGRDWFYVELRKHDGTKYGSQRRIIDRTKLRAKEAKALTQKQEKYPIAFFRNSPYNRRLVVVEDPWSALRIHGLPVMQMDAAALCGGDWCKDHALTVRGKYDEVLLCLDRDAQKKAITQAMAHASIQRVVVVIPRVDIKNMEDEEVLDFLTRR